MPSLTLVVRPDGRAILTSPEPLDADKRAELREAIAGWEAGRWPVLVLERCQVVEIDSLELAIDEPVLVPA